MTDKTALNITQGENKYNAGWENQSLMTTILRKILVYPWYDLTKLQALTPK